MSENRNIIKLEELKKEVEEEESQKQKKEDSSEYLSDEQIEEYLGRYRGTMPSFVLKELYELLRGKRVTEKQLKRIIERVEAALDMESQLRKIDDIYRKLEGFEKILRSISTNEEAREVDKVEVDKIEAGSIENAEGRKAIDSGTISVASENGRPRLKRIPDDVKSIMMLLKWIEYLIERVGYEGLEDALNYYLDINWISEDVLLTVLRYAKGIKLYHENSDWRPVGYLNVQDHLMSLLFIEALRTGKFNKSLVMEVEREVYRMKKEVAELHGL